MPSAAPPRLERFRRDRTTTSTEAIAPAEPGLARIVRNAAIHYSCQETTTHHANYTWKIHVGLDAPVWLASGEGLVEAARVIVGPPGTLHSTGALGQSIAIFVAAGTRKAAWRASSGAFALDGTAAQRIVDACRHFDPDAREDTAAFVTEIAGLGWCRPTCAPRIDARVEAALARLAAEPEIGLGALADSVHVRPDRLSRLVTRDTGVRLRQHALWHRLLRVLSSTTRYASVAEAAFAAGFADHAHMTRTYRAFLGRVPSDFTGPPDVLEPW